MEWEKQFSEELLNDAFYFIENNKYENLKYENDCLTVTITDRKSYDVKIQYLNGEVSDMHCTCPYGSSGTKCNHMAAACYMGEVYKKRLHPDTSTEAGKSDNTKEEPEVTVHIEEESKGLSLQAEVNDYYCYALQQNGGIPLVKNIVINNIGDTDAEDITLCIETDMELIQPYAKSISVIPAGDKEELSTVTFVVQGSFLASVLETVKCNLKISIVKEDEELLNSVVEINVLPFNHYPGFGRYTADLLSAYIIPNHPVVTDIVRRASQLIGEWTGDNSLAGYQNKSRERIAQTAKAVYTAIQELNISYINSPASFEDAGQKIRFPDEIMEHRMGTCMDMTLFYLACIEAIGINTIFVLIKGHIFSGVWLIEDGSFGGYSLRDASKLLKLSSPGTNDILLVESTKMCFNTTFEEATAKGRLNLETPEEFEVAVDVNHTRLSGIRPLPYRIKNEYGYSLQIENRDMSKLEGRDSIDLSHVDISDVINKKTEMTKQLQWEHKLLNLSNTNILVNTRISKVIPIISTSLDMIEDSLANDAEFEIYPLLDEWNEHGINAICYENTTAYEKYEAIVEKELKSHILHTGYATEKSLVKDLTSVSRASKSSMEESGVNPLYMTFGMLKWFDETTRKPVPRYAPIIMVPVDLTRKSATQGYVVKRRDEESIINYTLLELLKEVFTIEVSGLDPLPEDEHGLDIRKIFAVMRNAIINKPKWDIVECCTIGNFAFGQFVMWNDIHSHPQFLENNKIVKSLISGTIEWNTSIPVTALTDKPYLPVPVDDSQLKAINMAANGVSFVLHGPPGTGKSQTITAMIANALTKGKSVLFVAEKKVALEVVEKRLNSIGIGDFCLELHSNKATKRSVLDQIGKTLEWNGGVLQFSTDYEKRAKEIIEKRESLDEYAEALRRELPCGMSVRQVIDLYESIPDTNTKIKLSDATVKNIVENSFDDKKKLLETLVNAGRAIGHPHDHVFSFVGQYEYTQSLRMKLEDELDEYKTALLHLKDNVDDLMASLHIREPKSFSDWANVLGLTTAICDSHDVPAFLLGIDSLDVAFMAPAEYIQKREIANKSKASITTYWNEGLFDLNMDDLLNRYNEANARTEGKEEAVDAVLNEVTIYSKTGTPIKSLEGIATNVKAYQAKRMEAESVKARLLPGWNEVLSDENITAEDLEKLKTKALYAQKAASKYAPFIAKLSELGIYDKAYSTAGSFRTVLAKMIKEEKDINNLLLISVDKTSENWLEEKIKHCELIENNKSDLRNWIEFRAAEKACEDVGLGDVCSAYRNGMDHDQLVSAFLKAAYRAIVWNAIETNPVLNKFTGNSFNEQIRQFKELDDQFVEVTKEEILYKLTHNLPTTQDSYGKSKEMGILRKAIKSGGRGVTIRSVFQSAPHMIRKCCPCMLMSPMSVAQYLPPENDLFDLVIFDEASQLPTANAVGVIARGKNAVIVGDPNQMPPTNFFSGKFEDMENIELEDLDSILDDCLAIGMPETHLQWHYRSRHESLIAFSNSNYYENNMLTFPSVNDRERRVRLVKVNGRKIKNRNEREAQKIVEEVISRFNDERCKNQTLGIVTFNIAQKKLIEDMLQVEFQKNPDLEAWANKGDDSLFVKNLENVQGDERDVIIFSVTFGLDENDKLSLNFGPLNRDGGWKRLNVAVSRAKQEMIIFSSIDSSMIDQKKPSSRGVLGVRDFLYFAETGSLARERHEDDSHESEGIKKQICEKLKENGYPIKTDVGHSNFKVDIAVVNPDDPEEYLLGILLDGDTYQLSKNTRDREIAQKNVLEGLGWNLCRIWTMDWWDDKDREIKKVLNLIEELKNKPHLKEGKHALPESEEISTISTEPVKRKNRKKKGEKEETVIDFSKERFTPSVPHTDSFKEYEELLEKSNLDKVEEMMKTNEEMNTENTSSDKKE